MSRKQEPPAQYCEHCGALATVPTDEGWLCRIHSPNSDVEEKPTQANQAGITASNDDLSKFHEMARQMTSERLQVCVFAGINGEDIGPLTEAEQYFYDSGVEEAKANPGVVWSPIDF
jgi:hypothetical protein